MTDNNDDLAMIRHQAQKFLNETASPERLKALLDDDVGFDRAAWTAAVDLGWPLLYAPEALGGLDLGLPGMAVLAEELGRKTLSFPLIPAFVCLEAVARSQAVAPELTAIAGAIAEGSAIACLAFAEPGESGLPATPACSIADNQLSGAKALAPFAAVADYALVHARDGDGVRLALVPLDQPGVTRSPQPVIDQGRAAAALTFAGAQCFPLGSGVADVWALAAVATAWEQLGGAQEAMEMARDYALERKVFGQQIGRFQAIKHKIADMYWRIELARGCAIDAVEALAAGDDSWRAYGAAARVAATAAYEFTAAENIMTHGGIGVTWEGMPQHHYRRSRVLAVELGSAIWWRDVLLQQAGMDTDQGDLDEARDPTPEIAEYRLRARAWLAQHAPAFSGDVRKGLSFDEDVALGRKWQALKASAGYAAINLPATYGGGGASELHKIAFGQEELKYQLPTEYFTISTSQVMAIFLRYGSDEFRQELGPKAIRGEHIWCQMFSEPGAGSDLAAVRLRAERSTRDGVAGWLLNGQKLWTSWAQISEWGFVVARSDFSQLKHKGITTFFVNMHSPGIQVRPIRRMAGHPDVNEVFFDNVFVPDTQRLGPENQGFGVAMEMLMIERVGGVYDECLGGPNLEFYAATARSSRISGQPAIGDGQVRAALAQAYVERLGLRSIYRRDLIAVGGGKEPGPEGAIRKLVIGRNRQRMSALMIDLLGAQGAGLDPLADARLDAAMSWLDPAGRIAGGTDEVLLSTIAEKVLNLPQDHRPDKGIPFNQIS